jgi:hypothetical protein
MSAIQKEVYNRRRRRNSANGLCYLIIKFSLKKQNNYILAFQGSGTNIYGNTKLKLIELNSRK